MLRKLSYFTVAKLNGHKETKETGKGTQNLFRIQRHIYFMLFDKASRNGNK
jgi:hypothetical protein